MNKGISIWTITTVPSYSYDGTGKYGEVNSRCWGFKATKEAALKSALENADFYSECGYYTHIVIEECRESTFWYDMNPTWVELKQLDNPIEKSEGYFDDYEAKVVETPEWARCIVGWGIG